MTAQRAQRAKQAPAKKTSSITLKLVMAGTGILLVLFLFAHMAGNLKIFVGTEAFDHYAH
jgi:succinate dehydrogenase / fumarate reductase cytochrome b subunit